MKEQIFEALNKLDPSNDQHWTGQGLPSVLAVSQLSGVKTLTRKQIDEVSALTRALARIPVHDKPELSLIEQRALLEDELTDVQKQIHSLSVHKRELTESILMLDARIEKETPKPNTAQLIQVYQQSQQNLKRESPSGPSPLDQAMAQKRGRGRPEFPPPTV